MNADLNGPNQQSTNPSTNEKENEDIEAVKGALEVKTPIRHMFLRLFGKPLAKRQTRRGSLPHTTKRGVAEFTELLDDSQLSRAVKLALRAYARRAATASPQTVFHPLLVGIRLMEHGFDTDTATVGILHDVLESPGLSPAELDAAGLPKRVVDAVIGLTHVPEIESYGDYLSSVAQDPIAAAVLVYDIATHGAAPAGVEMYPEDIIIAVLSGLKNGKQATGMKQK